MIRQTTGRSGRSRLEGVSLLGAQTQVALAQQHGSILDANPWSRALRLEAWTGIPAGCSLTAKENSRRLACSWACGPQPNLKRPSKDCQARGLSAAVSESSTASWWEGGLSSGLVPHLKTRTRKSEAAGSYRTSIGDRGFTVLSELTLDSVIVERQQLGASLESSPRREPKTHSTVGEEFRRVIPHGAKSSGPYQWAPITGPMSRTMHTKACRRPGTGESPRSRQ